MSTTGIDDYITRTGARKESIEALPRLVVTPTLAPEALYGLPGRIVQGIAPYTEAADVATLAHVLAAAGNIIGDSAHGVALGDRHPCRDYFCLVGETSKGRKGTAWAYPKLMFRAIDEAWATTRVRSGLSSGEGLIHHVRDQRVEKQPMRDKGGLISGYQDIVVDHGESDKRLFCVEPEFGTVLKRMGGNTNTLSAVLREAWDSGNLGTLTRHAPSVATGAHVSVVAHVTAADLRRYLADVDQANGFANRFLFVRVERSKVLPEAEPVPEAVLARLIDELRGVVSFARTLGEVKRHEAARALWAEEYPRLSEGQPGILGAITGRAEAHVLRLSVLYAVLDESPLVYKDHLRAALAVWAYAEASARWAFGRRLGLPLADKIYAALVRRGPMANTDLNRMVKGNLPADEIQAALDELVEAERIHSTPKATAGRTATVWEVVS